jgi:hypothetical protein
MHQRASGGLNKEALPRSRAKPVHVAQRAVGAAEAARRPKRATSKWAQGVEEPGPRITLIPVEYKEF